MQGVVIHRPSNPLSDAEKLYKAGQSWPHSHNNTMQFSLAVLSAIALAQAAYVPSEPWTTLTPSKTFSGASTDHTHSFGIQIVTISSSSASATASAAKRDVVNQITDGQIQQQTSETLKTPTAKTTASVINQISDGQIQH
ncbi:hypothetical protein OXX80_008189, partial [Metschnikowia pulcherrima]